MKTRRLVLALALVPQCLLPIATARAQDSVTARASSPSMPSVAHDRLAAFAGTWRRVRAPAGRNIVDTCAWMPEGRRHMMCRLRAERPGGASEQMAVYSYRGSDSTYTLTVFLSGGQVWRYAGRPEGNRWTFYQQSNRPGAPPRLRQIVLTLGDTLRFIEEVSEDGTAWRLSDPSEDYRSVRVVPATTTRPAPNEPTTSWQRIEGWPRLAPGLVLGQVSGVALDSRGHVWVFHRAGRSFDPAATAPIAKSTVLELDGDTGALLSSWGAGQFLVPHSISVDPRDDLWLTDVGRQQVLQFSRDGRLLLTVGERGVSGKDGAHFDQPTDVYVAADGSFYVSDGYNNSRVARFGARGEYLREWGNEGGTRGQFRVSHGITRDGTGRIYVADRENSRLQVFDSTGAYLKHWPTGELAGRVFDVAVSESGRVYVALKDSTDAVAILDRDLRELERIPVSAARVVTSHAIAVQGDSVIYLADTGGEQLLKLVRR